MESTKESREKITEQMKEDERLKVDLWLLTEGRKRVMEAEAKRNSLEIKAEQEEGEKGRSSEEAKKKAKLEMALITTEGVCNEAKKKGNATEIIVEGGISFSENLEYKLELEKAKHVMKEKSVKKPGSYELYAAWLHAAEMISDRGYQLDLSRLRITYKDFVKRVSSPATNSANLYRLSITTTHKSDTSDKVLVLLSQASGVTSLYAIEKFFPSLKPTRVILISFYNACDYDVFTCTISGRKVITETFNVAELFFNPVRGVQDEHFQLLTEEDLRLLRTTSSIPIYPLPGHNMRTRYFGLQKGGFLKAVDSSSEVTYFTVV